MHGSTLFWLLALGAAAAFLMLRAHTQARRMTQPRLASPRSQSRPTRVVGQAAEKPLEAQHWEVEMHDTVRAWSAQIDSKLGALQHLIRAAEQAATRLEAVIAESRYLGGPSPPPPAPPVPFERASNQADALRASLRPASESRSEHSAGTPSSPSDRPIARIHALADAGYDSAAIAQRVASPIGEVELILGLRRQSTG
jgi:hypothetical protein